MLRLQDVQLEREWERIGRLVDRRLCTKWTSESTTTMLARLEGDLEVFGEVAAKLYVGQPD
jgi:hypothetical protein